MSILYKYIHIHTYISEIVDFISLLPLQSLYKMILFYTSFLFFSWKTMRRRLQELEAHPVQKALWFMSVWVFLPGERKKG